MKLHIVSDLHTDSRSTRYDNPLGVELFDTDADVIIIAGDTSNRPERTFAFLEMVADTYPTKHVIATFGNHEYYAGDSMDINYDVIRYIDKNERKNLHILHDTYVVIDGVAFFGSVFWTAFFKGWLLLSQPPGCHSNSTSFST